MSCPDCHGTTWIPFDDPVRGRSAKRCPCAALLGVAVVPVEFREEPAGWSPPPRLEALDREHWPLGDGAPWVVTLFGGTGTGKSTAATWLWKRAVARLGAPSAWLALHAELEEARRGVNEAGERAFIAKCMRPGVVLFDDLANEVPGTMRERLVVEVLGRRHSGRLPTIITTNLTGDDLWDARLASRLRSGWALKIDDGIDWRQQKCKA